MTTPPPDAFHTQAADYGLDFEPGDVAQFGRYLDLLYTANQSFNLTAIEDRDEAWIRHVLDSLTLLPLLADVPDKGQVADVGSGGGAPGLILAIAQPRLSFTLIETTGKKAKFLRDTADALGLGNVNVVSQRAEDLGQDESFRASFDAVLARAVGRIAVVAELTVPLAKVGGMILLTKGQRAEEELAEAKQALYLLHTSCAGVIDTPTGRIVAIEKRRATPHKYPRRAGEPKRAPLGVVAPQVQAGDE